MDHVRDRTCLEETMNQSETRFTCTHSDGVPGLLRDLDVSLILSTYQAGKVILLSATETGLTQLARNFRKPMGIAVRNGRIAIATLHEVVTLENVPSLASSYPRKPGYYDSLFVPRASYYTGAVDLHDMAWSGDTLWGVNTLFSCLCHIDDRYSFLPVWRPSFVSALAPEDRCHLNGLAMADGRPRYVTAFATTDEPEGWRAGRDSGVVLDVDTGEVVLENLQMPHSPRMYDGRLFLLLSASAEFVVADPRDGTYEVVSRVPGYARGLSIHGDFAFVGHSRIRPGHRLGDLPISRSDHYAGIAVVNMATGDIVGTVRYHDTLEEIYDIHVLPRLRRPGILGPEDETHRKALALPETSYWARLDD